MQIHEVTCCTPSCGRIVELVEKAVSRYEPLHHRYSLPRPCYLQGETLPPFNRAPGQNFVQRFQPFDEAVNMCSLCIIQYCGIQYCTFLIAQDWWVLHPSLMKLFIIQSISIMPKNVHLVHWQVSVVVNCSTLCLLYLVRLDWLKMVSALRHSSLIVNGIVSCLIVSRQALLVVLYFVLSAVFWWSAKPSWL
jgi:hypothetical protein